MYFSAFRKLVWVFGQTAGVLVFAATLACSSDEEPSPGSGGQSGSGGSSGAASGGGGTTTTGVSLGSFSVGLEAASAERAASTSVLGKLYSGSYPKEEIETPIASGSGCTVYKYSLHSCIEVECSSSQRCAGNEDCRDVPRPVGVGDVSVTGFDAGPLTLSLVNNVYQYAGNITYPGIADGAALTLTASGGHYPAFTITSSGVAPMVLRANSHSASEDSPLLVEWEVGQNNAARVSIVLNLTRHGGSAGYLECDAPDSGSLTIPANLLKTLFDLGVAGFPQLVATRQTQGVVAAPGGQIALNVAAYAVQTLNIEGLCSCNDSGDCGSCADTTKTSCDAQHRLCVAP
jgi:hypothetical protein